RSTRVGASIDYGVRTGPCIRDVDVLLWIVPMPGVTARQVAEHSCPVGVVGSLAGRRNAGGPQAHRRTVGVLSARHIVLPRSITVHAQAVAHVSGNRRLVAYCAALSVVPGRDRVANRDEQGQAGWRPRVGRASTVRRESQKVEVNARRRIARGILVGATAGQ